MRIKIIGENNCARATRHLLRLAGFAVTEFLPAEVVTQAPHLGYAITIETSSLGGNVGGGEEAGSAGSMARAFSEGVTSISRDAKEIPFSNLRAALLPSGQASTARTRLAPDLQPLNFSSEPDADDAAEYSAAGSRVGTEGESPASEPESAPYDDAAVHEGAPAISGGASSPAFLSGEEKLLGGEGSDEGRAVGELDCGLIVDRDEKGKQAEACSTVGIHFDSVDGVLEAAILRHVAQLSAAPVMVDRPGGVVHSERELRIVLPVTGDARADEAAAVAVEFGVLRGLLDLTRRPSRGELGGESGVMEEKNRNRSGKSRWWIFGGVSLGIGLALVGAAVDAGTGAVGGVAPRGDRVWNGNGARAEVFATAGLGNRWPGLRLRNGVLPGVRAKAIKTTVGVAGAALMASPSAPVPAAAAQGQFATGLGGGGALDPCQVQTKLFVSISQTANSQLVAGTASKKIYVCSIHVVVAAATNVALVEGTGSVCATGTAGVSGFGGATAATGWNFMANGGIALGSGAAAVGGEGTNADNLCLFNSGSGQVSGGISYVVQ